jgi:hypothetical protein
VDCNCDKEGNGGGNKGCKHAAVTVGGPQEKMPFFQVAPGPTLSSSIHSNSFQMIPVKFGLKNDHFLTCGDTKVHIFVYTSD